MDIKEVTKAKLTHIDHASAALIQSKKKDIVVDKIFKI